MFWDGKCKKISARNNSCVGVKKVERWMKQKETITNLKKVSNMKATKFISACAVLAALASCSNEHELSQQSAEDTPIRIQANVGGITTRAAHNLLSSFGNGDAINVYITENTTVNNGTSSGASYSPTVYTHNGSSFAAAPAQTQYFPSNGNGIDVWGVYPSTVIENTQNFTIESDQADDDKYKKSDLMFATKLSDKKKGNTINLSFTHQLSKIIVKLAQEDGVNADLTNAEIKLTNVVNKIALSSVSGSGITLGALSEVAGDKGELTIGKYAIEGTAAIVIPQSTTSMQFKVTLANGGTYTAAIPRAPENFVANTAYTYTLKLKANDISISAQINPWTAGTDGTGDANLQ